MPSVSLAVSVSELSESVSDARPITTVSCSFSVAIFFKQYTRSTDKTCSTYFKVVQLDPLSFKTFQVSPLKSCLASSSAAQWYSCRPRTLVEDLSFAWFSDIVSPFSFSCLQKLWIFCILHCIGMVFALRLMIDSFANELSTRQIEKKNLRVKHVKFKFS